jgi:hypothetical protein
VKAQAIGRERWRRLPEHAILGQTVFSGQSYDGPNIARFL